MRITSIEWFQVNQFVHEDMVNSPEYRAEEQKWDDVPKIILRIHTDQGEVGLGETPRGVSPESFAEEARALLGRDPLSLDLKGVPLAKKTGAIYQGLEVALFDLVGRIREVPVCELLGGRRTAEVQTSYWASRQTPEHSYRTARTAWQEGFTCLKIKAKQGDPLVERVRAMYDAAPDLQIIIDPMQRYDDLQEMIDISQALAPYNVLCLEDPLPKSRMDWFRRLREEGPIPVAMHVSTPAQIQEAIDTECVDIFNCSPSSMPTFVQMVALAETAGIPCWHGSGADLGILEASYLHAVAATTNCTIPSDILSFALHVDDFVKRAPERYGDKLRVPEGPGLGCELDMDAVDTYLIHKGCIEDGEGSARIS